LLLERYGGSGDAVTDEEVAEKLFQRPRKRPRE